MVRQVVVAEQRPAQGCREHAKRGEAAFTPTEATSTAALERQGAERERFCGHLALENAALTKGLNALPSRSGTR